MDVFVYDWSVVSHVKGPKFSKCAIRIWGLNAAGETVCMRDDTFVPHLFLEFTHVPEPWTVDDAFLQLFRAAFQTRFLSGIDAITTLEMTQQRKLYGGIFENGAHSRHPFLKIGIRNDAMYRALGRNRWENTLRIDPGDRGRKFDVQFRMHEQSIPIETQYTTYHKIPSAGWMRCYGTRLNADGVDNVADNDAAATPIESRAVHEIMIDRLESLDNGADAPPTSDPFLMSFDIETYSSVPNQFSNPLNPGDCIFQISVVLWNRTQVRKFLITLGEPVYTEPRDYRTLTRTNERHLLRAFLEIIAKWQPIALTGYNIFKFDLPFILDRAHYLKCTQLFNALSFLQNVEVQQESTRRGERYFHTHGRIWIDLMHVAIRDLKLENYKLETVASSQLGTGKDPITPADIMRAYRDGVANPTDAGRRLLGEVGKYCVKDSDLVRLLFCKLDVWNGLVEMAAVAHVSPRTIFTTGPYQKTLAQVYLFCKQHGIVVNSQHAKKEPYKGATVRNPRPGRYSHVVPFDFASLYPSIIMAYNIDYTSIVAPDVDIDPALVHTIHCEETRVVKESVDQEPVDGEAVDGDTNPVGGKKVSKQKRTETVTHTYRFLKEPAGVVPTMIRNAVDARNETRKKQRAYAPDAPEYSALEKRQLAYKVAANAMYGIMGMGYGLSFIEGARAITALGRQNSMYAGKVLAEQYHASIVYGDTDSIYVRFPHIANPNDLWGYANTVQKAMKLEEIFPPPMRLDFEDKIYADFMILTKKRYMYKKFCTDGTTDPVIGNKGVLLSRRDNCLLEREIYERVVSLIFEHASLDTVLDELAARMSRCFQEGYSRTYYIMTKKVNDIDRYKIKPLPEDPIKRAARLKKLGATAETYASLALPPHIQLAQRMRARGVQVDSGDRISYVVVINRGSLGNLFDVVEDVDYHAAYSRYVPIDCMYYLKKLCNNIDQLLAISFQDAACYRGTAPRTTTKLVTRMYEETFRARRLLVDEMNLFFGKRVVLMEE